MATFRISADGRTVISDDNRVTVQAGDIDRGGFTALADGFNRVGGHQTVNSYLRRRRWRFWSSRGFMDQAGTGYMTRSEFELCRA